MRVFIAAALAMILTPAALSSYANAPEPTYDQTRDWIVATISQSAGYTRDAITLAYKDVSMDGCQLGFTTSTSTATSTENDTFIVPLDSVKSIIWGTASNPMRGYVIFTAEAPISFNRQLIRHVFDGEVKTTNGATRVAYLEFGKPGADYADLASHMRTALLQAADLCQVRLAAK